MNQEIIEDAIRQAEKAIQKASKQIGDRQADITKARNSIDDLRAEISLKEEELNSALKEIRELVAEQNVNQGTIQTLKAILDGSLTLV